MKLTMRIENYDALDDGGPLSFEIDGDGFEAGRDSALDWTLPDETRHISSRHFGVEFRGGVYYITDFSTNGTFRVGETNRIPSPLQLYGGERFQVGQYVIAVTLEAAQAAAAPAPGGSAGFGSGSGAAADPWSMGGATPAPMPVRDLVPDRERRSNYDDVFIQNPASSSPPASSVPPGGIGAPAAPGGIGSPPSEPPRAMPSMPPGPGFGPQPGQAPGQATGQQASTPPAPAFGTPPSYSATGGDLGSFLAALCQGAGLPPDAFSNVEPTALAAEIGQSLRIATEGLMALLAARAQAKTFVRSSSRTMIGATDNNPMKFLPDPGQAIDAMFFHKRAGFMDGVAGFGDAFDDIKSHQAGVYAAIQPALAELLDDLSPDSIEARTGKGGLMGGKKSAAWDVFVQRWDAKTLHHDNGMLDVFLKHFADAYDRATKDDGKS